LDFQQFFTMRINIAAIDPQETTAMAERATGGVQSVERVFELLELITDAGGDVTLSELSASTDLPLPTIHRLLRTLVGLGYIRQLPNRRYALGPRLIRLGEAADKQLGAVARPQLTSLVDRLIRERGYAIDEEEQEIGVRCFAMAIPDAPTQAAISVSGPVSRLDESFAGRAVPLLREAALAISHELSRH
jgi:DNA-binding IclR family transcriptional regulator